MSNSSITKYSAEEWDYIRKRFYNSILNETEIAKLGQNVGISWPFKGTDETPSKYMDYDFEELQSVPDEKSHIPEESVLPYNEKRLPYGVHDPDYF